MNFEQCLRELAEKERSAKDLIRFVSNRTDSNANYSLLLGAGCSITSGVRSATTLCDLWRRQLYTSYKDASMPGDASIDDQREFLSKKHGIWYDVNREYSSLFEKLYDTQRQRRVFVESEVADKLPSIGYAYLTALVQRNYFNTVFTTNFDDLVNEAFYLYSTLRPIVCAHDSSINSVTVTSKRPKVIKLHGDYLFEDLKATARETESLEANMKAKFSEFARNFGLIVVGYGGGDRSILDVLAQLLKNDECFKSGIYWCARRGAEVSEDLRKLFRKDRVYLVPIDGFDELFAEIYSGVHDGAILPSEALETIKRPAEVISKLISSDGAFPQTTEQLRKAKALLEHRSKRSAIANVIARPNRDESTKSIFGSTLTDDEFLLLAKIQAQCADENYVEAIESAKQALDDARPELKLQLLDLMITCSTSIDAYPQARHYADEMISLQPKRASHYLTKASLCLRRSEAMRLVEEAIKQDPYYYMARAEKAERLLFDANKKYGNERQALLKIAEEAIKIGVELYPVWTNPCWALRLDLLRHYPAGREREEEEKRVLDLLCAQDRYAYGVLKLRVANLARDDKGLQVKSDDLLLDLDEAIERASAHGKPRLAALRVDVLRKYRSIAEVRSYVDRLLDENEVVNSTPLTLAVVKALRRRLDEEDRAEKLLIKRLDVEYSSSVAVQLFDLYMNSGDAEKAEATLLKYAKRLLPETRETLEVNLLELRGDFDAASKRARENAFKFDSQSSSSELFYALKLGQNERAEELAKEILRPSNYSCDASSEIVNYELARKRLGKKPDPTRLEKLLAAKNEHPTRAAVFALLNKKDDMLDELRKELNWNKTFRYFMHYWPVFDEYRRDDDFTKLLDKGSTILASVRAVA